jgi:hypothetical protein
MTAAVRDRNKLPKPPRIVSEPHRRAGSLPPKFGSRPRGRPRKNSETAVIFDRETSNGAAPTNLVPKVPKSVKKPIVAARDYAGERMVWSDELGRLIVLGA